MFASKFVIFLHLILTTEMKFRISKNVFVFYLAKNWEFFQLFKFCKDALRNIWKFHVTFRIFFTWDPLFSVFWNFSSCSNTTQVAFPQEKVKFFGKSIETGPDIAQICWKSPEVHLWGQAKKSIYARSKLSLALVSSKLYKAIYEHILFSCSRLIIFVFNSKLPHPSLSKFPVNSFPNLSSFLRTAA